MTISKLGRCISAVTTLLATLFAGILAVCCFHVMGRTKSVEGAGAIGDYLKYLTLPALLAFVFAALIVGIKLIANDKQQKKTSREILSVYEAIYKIRSLGAENDKKFHKILKTRNIIDLIACQLSLLCYLLAVDYLLFISKFSYESIDADILGALKVVLPFALSGSLILIVRAILSERMSRQALKLVEGDKQSKKMVAVLKKSQVTESFFRFKARVGRVVLARSILAGLSAGAFLGAALWTLCKRCIISLDLLICLAIGGGFSLLIFLVFFLLGRKSNSELACILDEEFDLKARVQTMVEFSDSDNQLAELQREDTQNALSGISSRSYKFRGLWACIVAVAIACASVTASLMITDIRGYTPPEQVEPFELSALQEAGLSELIAYVESSELEDEFKAPMTEELKSLLNKLRSIKTMPEMQATLIESMAALTDITYRSSSAAEMLNALWDTEDLYFRHLAVVLDTSTWTSPDWGDFAEKTHGYVQTLMGDGDETPGATLGAQRVKAAIDGMTRKLDAVLKASGLEEDDHMYIAVSNLFRNDLVGLSRIVNLADYMTDDEIRQLLTTSLNLMSEDTFNAISINRTNAIVGEYTLTRLSSLFGVSAPPVERSEFVKNGELPESGQGGNATDEENKENADSDGGVGKGETFGSDDLVLDPITGKYVKYGDLLKEKYYAIMYERLQSDFYTEEQKEAIMKYFEMLFSGVKNEEGN